MSSTNSINYGDDFTSAENGEVNGDAISLNNDGQFDGKNSESIADQQQLKEFREKYFFKMEMELKMAKLEIENKEQNLKLQEMMVEQKTLKEKMAKIEQKKEKNAIAADQLTKILEKISEMEKQQKQQNEYTTKATEERFSQLQNDQKIILDKFIEMEKQQKEQSKENSDQLSKMQNDQKTILEKISEFEKEQKQRKALLNFRQNYWDAKFCDERIEIIGQKNLIVRHKENDYGWGSVFAKHPILLNNNLSDIFYYEISIQNKKHWMSFGFTVKQQQKRLGFIMRNGGTYAFNSDGGIWIKGERQGINGKYSYCNDDTVGIGVNSATRQIVFTKNGLRLDFSDFFIDPSFADSSFHPFVFLLRSGDQIEANFGPNFKFELTTL